MNSLEKMEEKRKKLHGQREKITEEIKQLDKKIEAERLGDISRAAKEVNMSSKEYRNLVAAIKSGEAQKMLQRLYAEKPSADEIHTEVGQEEKEGKEDEKNGNEQ